MSSAQTVWSETYYITASVCLIKVSASTFIEWKDWDWREIMEFVVELNYSCQNYDSIEDRLRIPWWIIGQLNPKIQYIWKTLKHLLFMNHNVVQESIVDCISNAFPGRVPIPTILERPENAPLIIPIGSHDESRGRSKMLPRTTGQIVMSPSHTSFWKLSLWKYFLSTLYIYTHC